jgi:hypothetical protein
VFKILYYGEEHILHLEFETGSDGDLPSRLLVYNAVLYRDYKLPVITIVVYPFPVEQAESPLEIKSNGEELLTFRFRTLPLFTLDAEQFVQEHRACMYPLLPAMNGVHAEVMQELTELYRDDEITLAQQFTWMKILLERTSTVTSLEKGCYQFLVLWTNIAIYTHLSHLTDGLKRVIITHMEEKRTKQYSIRFPLDLFNRIDQMAKKDERSFNAQVIWMIKDYFRQGDERKDR